eukprot:gene8933-9885_t
MSFKNTFVRLWYAGVIIVVADSLKIKIIDAPFSLQNAGLQTQHQAAQQPNVVNKLTAKVKPQALSGPPHLFALSGKCFKLDKTSFNYEFCPFDNATQREDSFRWNAFHGVLGIWQEWKITNETFDYMLMTNGETCVGQIEREVMVYFKCGAENKFEDIQEPTVCKYNLTFQTPLACAQDAFMVYPTLSETGKQEWDEIEDGFIEKELTLQGYHKRRNNLFSKEGIFVQKPTAEGKNKENNMAVSNSLETKSDKEDNYRSFGKDQCIEEYAKLLEEVKRLRQKLDSYKLNETKTKETSEVVSSIKVTRTPETSNVANGELSQNAEPSSRNRETNESQKSLIKDNDAKLENQEKSVNHKSESLQPNITSRRKGKMGDEGMPKQGVPFKESRKRKNNGKMGDDGVVRNDSIKNSDKLEGHWLGRFLENARKGVDLKADKFDQGGKGSHEGHNVKDNDGHVYH